MIDLSTLLPIYIYIFMGECELVFALMEKHMEHILGALFTCFKCEDARRVVVDYR